MHFIRALRFQLGLLAITLLMALGGYYVTQAPGKQASQGLWVTHTREVMDQLDVLSKHIAQAQLAKGNMAGPGTLAAAPGIEQDIEKLQALTADNSIQQDRITALRSSIEMIDKASGNAARTSANQESETTIATMQEEELRLLEKRKQAWTTAVGNSKTIVLVGMIGLYLTICFVYYLLSAEAERRRMQAVMVQQEATRLSRIVEVQHTISQHRLDLEQTMRVITDNVIKLVVADGAIIEIVEGNEMVYVSASGSGSPHVGMRIAMNNSLSGYAVCENRLVVSDDTELDDRVDKVACRRVGVRSMVVAPFQKRGVPIGVLKVLSAQPNAFKQADIDTVELLTSVISGTMSDATTIESIRSVNQSLTKEKHELQFANAQLQSLATTDGLTKLKNHRYFREQLAHEFNRAKRYGTPFSLVLMDVDHFKQFNDTFGHPAGDEVLKNVGTALKSLARTTDTVARHGGEEFAVILPETEAEGAAIIAERLRKVVQDAPWDLRSVTISVGVATYHGDMENDSALLETADKALYSAKKTGRNRVFQCA